MKRIFPIYTLLFVAPILFFSSCASIPRQSVDLSMEMNRMVLSSRKAHLELLDSYTALRLEQAEQFLEEHWIPSFTARFVEESNVLNYIEKAETAEEKGAEMIQFAQAALPVISEKQNELFKVINEIDNIVRGRIDSHYQEIINVNQALTAHLSSAAKVVEIRQQFQKQANINIENLIPLDEMNETIEKLLKISIQGEKIPDLITEFKNKLK